MIIFSLELRIKSAENYLIKIISMMNIKKYKSQIGGKIFNFDKKLYFQKSNSVNINKSPMQI